MVQQLKYVFDTKSSCAYHSKRVNKLAISSDRGLMVQGVGRARLHRESKQMTSEYGSKHTARMI